MDKVDEKFKPETCHPDAYKYKINFQCGYCNEIIEKESDMKEHLKNIHLKDVEKRAKELNDSIIKVEAKDFTYIIDDDNNRTELWLFECIRGIQKDEAKMFINNKDEQFKEPKRKLKRYSININPENLLTCLEKLVKERNVAYDNVVIDKTDKGKYTLHYFVNDDGKKDKDDEGGENNEND